MYIATVYATEKELLKAYWNPKIINILQYRFLGIHKNKDTNIENCSNKEWETIRKQPCLYALAFKTIPQTEMQLKHHYTTLYNLKRAVKRHLRKE